MRFIVVDKREGNQRASMSTQFPKSSQSLRGGNTRKPPCILKSIPGENIIPKVPTTRLVRRGFHLLILVTHIRIGRTRAHRCQRPPSSPPVMQCMAVLPSVCAWIFMKEGHIGKIPSVSLLSVFFCFLGVRVRQPSAFVCISAWQAYTRQNVSKNRSHRPQPARDAAANESHGRGAPVLSVLRAARLEILS